MKKSIAIVAALAAGAFAMNAAEARGVVSLSIGVPLVAPVYAAPPAYYAPAPAYYAPPPVRYAPAYGYGYAPAYRYAPAPVIYGGWGPDRARWEHERFEHERWARDHRAWGR